MFCIVLIKIIDRQNFLDKVRQCIPRDFHIYIENGESIFFSGNRKESKDYKGLRPLTPIVNNIALRAILFTNGPQTKREEKFHMKREETRLTERNLIFQEKFGIL